MTVNEWFFNQALTHELGTVKNGFRASKSSSSPEYTAARKTV